MVEFLKKTLEGVVRLKGKKKTEEPKPQTSSKTEQKKQKPRKPRGTRPPEDRSGPEKSSGENRGPEKTASGNRKRNPQRRRSNQKPSKEGQAPSSEDHKPRPKRSNAPKKNKPARRPSRREQREKMLQEHESWNPDSFTVEPEEGKTRFQDLPIHDAVLHAISDLNFEYCTPIQAEILGPTLDSKDATGQAQTGTGKTAAFLISAFCRLMREDSTPSKKPGTPRALVLAPTRELVVQIDKDSKDLGKYLPLETVACYGGTGYGKQEDLLSDPVDIIAATPGRLIDFCQKRIVDLSQVEMLIIDEADRMLDMGFIPDVKKIVYMTPHKDKRQTLFFSATLTGDVERLANSWTKDAVNIVIEPESVASEQVDQKVYTITSIEKFKLLYNLLKQKHLTRVMVFANRRDQAEDLAVYLHAYGFKAALISGALPQNQRTRTLEDFREGRIDIMVATDVAGRGIHINDVSHVINYHLPLDPEDYVHRIGRTGRAGTEGTSISFACEEDGFHIPDIEEYLGRELACEVPEEELLAEIPSVSDQALKESRSKFSRGDGNGGSRNSRGGGGGGQRSRSRSGSQGGGGRGGRPPRRR